MEEAQNDTAKCFVPEMLVEFINNNVCKGKECIEPISFFLSGVCLLVDISGFTKLSGDFCGLGKSGIDELQLATNGYMGQLVNIIYEFGGEIIKFAGDAIICIFSSHFISAVSTKEVGGKLLRRSIGSFSGILSNIDFAAELGGVNSPSRKETKAKSSSPSNYKTKGPSQPMSPDVVLRAMHCAHKLRDVQTEKLSVHVAMSCGEMCFGILGGYENRWECLISGPCLQELSDCLDDAPSKQAVISNDCAMVLNTAAAADELHSHQRAGVTSVTSESGRYQYTLQALPSGNHRIIHVTCEHSRIGSDPKLKSFGSETSLVHNSKIASNLIKQFVPTPIADQLESGTGLNYLAEIREVTTMFMKWDSYDVSGPHRDLLRLQSCFYEAQKVLQRTGAYLRQFLVDDKGCVLIACWGMPNLSYLDNPHRALSAAAQIRRKLNKMDMQCSFGITTGDVYCGTVGSPLRMEYAAIGSVVNMSARLMCKAHGGILIDDTTYSRLPADVLPMLTALEPMKVKGREEPLQVYNYVAAESLQVHEKVVDDSEISPKNRETMTQFMDFFSENAAKTVGHTPKMRRPGIANVKDWVSKSGPAELPADLNTLSLLLIKGKEGSGRTTVVKWLRKHVQDRSVPAYCAKLSRKDSQTDYILWKKLFALLMPKGLFLSNEMQRTYVQALLKEVYPSATQAGMYAAFPVMKETLGMTCTLVAPVGPGMGMLKKSKSRWSASKMTSSQSAMSTTRIVETLCTIFTYLLNAQASVIIVENVENADEGSLKVLEELLGAKSRSAIVLTALDNVSADESPARAGPTYQTGSYRKNVFNTTSWSRQFKTFFVNHKSSTVITLENYTPEEVDRMLRVALKIETVPVEISQLVQDFSGGSCFWVREILQFINDYGAEQFMSAVSEPDTAAPTPKASLAATSFNEENDPRSFNKSKLTLSKPSMSPSSSTSSGFQRKASNAKSFRSVGSRNSRSVESPHQVQLDKLVLCRFGSLSPDVQRALRTASIIGFTFSENVLMSVLPTQLKEQLLDCFQTLLNQRWIYQDFDNESLYQFAHDHTHRLIYELTPSSERNNTHRQIAEYLEETFPNDPVQYGALSYHYQQCDPAKALAYTSKATDVLLKQAKVIYDFGDCLDLLAGSTACCRSTQDVDVLLNLITLAKVAIEEFSLAGAAEPLSCTGWLLKILIGRRNDAAVHPGGSADGDDEDDEITLPEPELKGGDLSGSAAAAERARRKVAEVRFERRSKRMFLKQLIGLYDDVCEKYVEFADAEDVF